MKKISLNGLEYALSRKELKNVTGGSGYHSCWAYCWPIGGDHSNSFYLPPGLCGTSDDPLECERNLEDLYRERGYQCVFHC